MEKILLVIDGITPDRKAFNYAIELCQRIKAELKVLQIVGHQESAGYLNAIRKKANQARQYLEGSMMAATFAEAGEYDSADALISEALENFNKLLPETEKAGVPCQHTIKSGSPRDEIVTYVRKNRDVVAAIYDTPDKTCPKPIGRRRKKKNAQLDFLSTLPVPVVIVQDEA